jgi:hypothetical protein
MLSFREERSIGRLLRMDTLLALIIALGGIATGIGALWAALVARRSSPSAALRNRTR